MNAIEMIYQFELYLGTLDMVLQKPKTRDILDFLNIAQGDAHENAYRMMDADEYQKKLLAPFMTIDKEISTFTPYTGSIPNAVRIALPSDLLYVIREELKVNVDEFGRIGNLFGPTIRGVRPIDFDFYNTNKRNPVRMPNYEESWRLDAKYFIDVDAGTPEHLLIMAEGIVPETYYVSYIKNVTDLTEEITSVSEFPEWHHDSIVKEAVQLYAKVRSPQQEPQKTG